MPWRARGRRARSSWSTASCSRWTSTRWPPPPTRCSTPRPSGCGSPSPAIRLRCSSPGAGPGAPLGGFPYASCPELETSLRPGETLVLYTDGLIERRGTPLSQSLSELAEAVREARSAEAACRLAVGRLIPAEGLADDAAILALHNVGVPERLRLDLPAEPGVLSGARRVLRRWLRARGASEPVISELALATNEACANAVEHAYPPGPASFELIAEAPPPDPDSPPAEVVITVRDHGRWRPPRGEGRGRGLTIIEAAVDRLDVKPSSNGTEVVMRRRLTEEARAMSGARP